MATVAQKIYKASTDHAPATIPSSQHSPHTETPVPFTMPPKRPHDDASTSRPRKRAKREEDSGSDFEQRESDEVYDFDEDSELFEESSDSEPPKTSRIRFSCSCTRLLAFDLVGWVGREIHTSAIGERIRGP